jgi:quercetin dioxygenase-like cupin family protein
MKYYIIAVSFLFLISAAALAAKEPNMKTDTSKPINVIRAEQERAQKGPAEYFTGDVKIDSPFGPDEPSHIFGASVTFEPGARTAWHVHPLGQLLVVTDGKGFVQRWGETAQEIQSGDLVWIPAHTKHWHGASPDTAMTHIAVQEQLDGSAVEWQEKVSDEQYGAKHE